MFEGAGRATDSGFVPNTILVHTGLELIGDGLLKLPFLREMRRMWPDAHVTWVCGKGKTVFTSVLADAVEGLIDEIIEEAHIGESWTELFGARPFNGRRFDLIIDTQKGPIASLVLRRLPHKRLITPAGRWVLSDRRPEKSRPKSRNMLRQMLDLLELGSDRVIATPKENILPVSEAMMASVRAVLPDDKNYIGLAPGAGGRHKCWPRDNFVELARLLAKQGFTPAVLLGPAEQDWFEEMRQALPEAAFPLQDERLELSVMTSVAIGRCLAAAVTNDAGIGHLMAASGAPLIILYGPTSPEKFSPLAGRGRFVTAQECGGSGMSDIPVERVATEIKAILAV
jgi:ADP-heptose:LPS heptosyltransferase